jgi:uncharacterized protein YndB with AHSA1/START domain
MDADRMDERRLTLSRHYDAARDLVFAAWTDPDRMRHWWGPAGWSIGLSEADLRPGGAFRYAMRSPEGDEHVVEGTITDVDPPALFVTLSELGGDGMHPPVTVVTTVTFEESGAGTLVTVETCARARDDMLDSATEGMEQHWAEHLDRLRDHLAGFQEERA